MTFFQSWHHSVAGKILAVSKKCWNQVRDHFFMNPWAGFTVLKDFLTHGRSCLQSETLSTLSSSQCTAAIWTHRSLFHNALKTFHLLKKEKRWSLAATRGGLISDMKRWNDFMIWRDVFISRRYCQEGLLLNIPVVWISLERRWWGHKPLQGPSLSANPRLHFHGFELCAAEWSCQSQALSSRGHWSNRSGRKKKKKKSSFHFSAA